MSSNEQTFELVALVADRDIQETLTRLFGRSESLQIRAFSFAINRHQGRDAGCRANASNLLRPFLATCRHAIVVFDRHGCGSASSCEEIERTLEAELSQSGWENRARVVVIDPELEVWLWTDSSVVSRALGWMGSYSELRSWLEDRGTWEHGSLKPNDPKAVMRSVLQETRRRRSARIFGEIAGGVSLRRCRDPAFRKLTDTLREWFA